MRWEHPQRGLVSPAEFIPLAEERGMVGEIDAFVLDTAVRQLAEWRAFGVVDKQFVMAVNVSGHGLEDSDLARKVAAVLQRHSLPPSQLCLEITETALVGELDGASQTVAALSALGVHLALDDFGTGYSTLAHLQQLHTDILKIDRSFVARLSEEPRDRKIIAGMVMIAHGLGMTVVAEGIETKEQQQLLAEINCDEGQGFVFAPSLSASDFLARKNDPA